MKTEYEILNHIRIINDEIEILEERMLSLIDKTYCLNTIHRFRVQVELLLWILK